MCSMFGHGVVPHSRAGGEQNRGIPRGHQSQRFRICGAPSSWPETVTTGSWECPHCCLVHRCCCCCCCCLPTRMESLLHHWEACCCCCVERQTPLSVLLLLLLLLLLCLWSLVMVDRQNSSLWFSLRHRLSAHGWLLQILTRVVRDRGTNLCSSSRRSGFFLLSLGFLFDVRAPGGRPIMMRVPECSSFSFFHSFRSCSCPSLFHFFQQQQKCAWWPGIFLPFRSSHWVVPDVFGMEFRPNNPEGVRLILVAPTIDVTFILNSTFHTFQHGHYVSIAF